MKQMGLLLVVLGLIGGAAAFSMDVSVEAGGERFGSGAFAITIPKTRVNNLGLMEDRRNYMAASGLAVLAGVILFGFGSLQQTASVASVKEPVPEKSEMDLARELAIKIAAGRAPSAGDIESLVKAAAVDSSLVCLTNKVTGDSLLHFAARADLDSEARALIALGAPADRGNGNGKYPYQLSHSSELTAFLKMAAGQGEKE